MDVIDYNLDLRPVVADATKVDWYGDIKDKPLIEQELFRKQTEWYESKDDKKRLEVWQSMFSDVCIYARSMVLQKLKNKKFLTPDVVDGHANNAALKFMSQYLYRKNFKCGTSFGKMINFKVVEAVYGNIKDDKNYSLNMESDNSDNFDLLSASKTMQISLLWGREYDDVEETLFANESDNQMNIIYDFLNEIDDVVKDDLIRLKVRMYLNILLKKPKNRHIKDQFIKHNCNNKREIDVINLVELNLYKRFAQYKYATAVGD